tara:strand:- start:229 stop:639 length:411 start_codon:yes stop_codon:yes gene_type:complete
MSEKQEEVVETTSEVAKWSEGDQTHGARGVDVKGLEGCIRVKGCRELGGIDVAIFETAVAFPNRAGKEKWTVKVIGMGDNGPMHGTKTRKEAMKAARYPSVWSKKCANVAQKVREAKEAKVEETKESEAEAEVVAE